MSIDHSSYQVTKSYQPWYARLCMVRSTLIIKKSTLHPNASRCRVPGFPRKADDPTDAHKEEDETSPGAEDCEGPSPHLCNFLQSSFYIYVLRPYTAKLCNWESNRQSASAGVLTRNLSWNKHDHSKSFVRAANELLDQGVPQNKNEPCVQCKCSTHIHRHRLSQHICQ